jgi:hypothetical protein
MSVSPQRILREQEKRGYARSKENLARYQSGRESSDVAEVVNRPKKRPGRRLRSSITIRETGRQAMV